MNTSASPNLVETSWALQMSLHSCSKAMNKSIIQNAEAGLNEWSEEFLTFGTEEAIEEWIGRAQS